MPQVESGTPVEVESADQSLVLTIKETCFELKTTPPTIYEFIRRGELRAKKLGRRTVIPRDEVRRFLACLPDLTLKA
jgi:excisionase family DNA binding protein